MIAAVEDVLGRDLDAIEREFLEAVPYMYPPLRQCADIPHVERGPDGEWRYASVMDCDAENTFGPYERLNSSALSYHDFGRVMHQGFTIEIPETAKYEVEIVGAEDVNFERCGTEPAPTKADAWMFGRASVNTNSIFAPRTELKAGLWRADVFRPYGDPAPVEVVIREYIEADSE
ncbi:MAG: hypothetical protein HC927_05870 [Deltaproteobacteria bacterium]|nr:hypothetical protein [Deltaproteobacteria bacterium]